VVKGRCLFWAVARKLICVRACLAPSLGAQEVNKISDSPYLTILVLLQFAACNSTSIDVRIFRCRWSY